MALFPKSPAKKPGPKGPEPNRPDIAPRPADMRGGPAPSARDVAAKAVVRAGQTRARVDPAPDISVAGLSLMELAPAAQAFEVAQANPGLCSVLENAALLFAGGQAANARAVLDEGIKNDDDAKLSPLAWLALFDLLQRAGDRTAFDQFALQYVVQFERSAPPWETNGTAKKAAPRAPAGGYIGLTGQITAATATQLEGLRKAMANSVSGMRIDAISVTGFDDEGARLLARALGEARMRKFALQLQRMEKLKPHLDAAVKLGRDGGEGAWLLGLELLQWANDRDRFEDRAVEFAVEFEVSPPSWEPPPAAVVPMGPKETTSPAEEPQDDLEGDVLAWSGVMAGASAQQLSKLALFAQARAVAAVDMAAVERVDFVCAGALLNLVSRVESQRKSVQFVGATPIIRAMLLLIGISPRHFVKKRE